MKKILIISNDTNDRGTIDAIRNVSRNLKAQVTGVVDSYEKAMDSIAKNSPNIIVSDTGINGEMDGISILNKLKDHYIIPVIFIADTANPAILEKAQGIQVAGFIVKPIIFNQLEITLQMSSAGV